MNSIYFSEKTWEELKDAIKKSTLILFPIGTIEEHGKHLPVETDTIIAKEITKAVAEKIKNKIPVLVLPTIWSGYSAKEMSRWPGTIRLRTRTFMDLIYDISASIVEMGFKKIILINGHGHHTDMLKVISREIADSYNVYIAVTDVASFAIEAVKKYRKSKIGGCIHGDEFETSLLLYINRSLVNMKKVTNVDIMRYHSKFYPGDNFAGNKKVFWSTWGIQKSKTGIYGDPTVASKETGEKIFKETVNTYIEFIKEFYKK